MVQRIRKNGADEWNETRCWQIRVSFADKNKKVHYFAAIYFLNSPFKLIDIFRLIEDQVAFKKQVFITLMKVVSTQDFLTDEIQRIIRFVKQHESITEREYLDAIESSGHAIPLVLE